MLTLQGMSISTHVQTKKEAPNDAAAPSADARHELACNDVKPPSPEEGPPTEDPYDNIACTD